MTKCTIFLLTALVLLGAKCEDNYYYYEEGTDVIKYSDLPGTEGDSDAWTAEAKNDLVSGDKKGFGWQKKFVNDIWGFFQAALKKANETPDDVQETADSSQILDAVQGHEVSLTKLVDGTANITNSGGDRLYITPDWVSIHEKATVTPSVYPRTCVDLNFMSVSISKLLSAASSEGTRLHPIGIEFSSTGVNRGDNVTMRRGSYSVTVTSVTAPEPFIGVWTNGAVLTGIPYGTLIQNLTLVKASQTFHLTAKFKSDSNGDIEIERATTVLTTSDGSGDAFEGVGTLIVDFDPS